MFSQKMELSIIILNYNTKELTLACLKSIKKFPYNNGLFEVIVVDNNSQDGSWEEFKAIKNKIQNKNLKLKLIRNKENYGFAKGNNIGIKKAKGKHILLLNSDTEVTKNALNKLVDFAKKNAEAGVVAPRLLNPNGTIQPSVFRLPTLTRSFAQYVLKRRNILDKYAPEADKPVEIESAVGAAFLITPIARKKVGLLDERYFMYFEDLDYCRRVRRANLKVYYLPNVFVFHVHGASGESSSIQLNRLRDSSKIYHGFLKHFILNLIIRLDQKFTYICLPKGGKRRKM